MTSHLLSPPVPDRGRGVGVTPPPPHPSAITEPMRCYFTSLILWGFIIFTQQQFMQTESFKFLCSPAGATKEPRISLSLLRYKNGEEKLYAMKRHPKKRCEKRLPLCPSSLSLSFPFIKSIVKVEEKNSYAPSFQTQETLKKKGKTIRQEKEEHLHSTNSYLQRKNFWSFMQQVHQSFEQQIQSRCKKSDLTQQPWNAIKWQNARLQGDGRPAAVCMSEHMLTSRNSRDTLTRGKHAQATLLYFFYNPLFLHCLLTAKSLSCSFSKDLHTIETRVVYQQLITLVLS